MMNLLLCQNLKVLNKVPDLKLIRTFDNAIEAIGWLKENSADLIFLDIQMEH